MTRQVFLHVGSPKTGTTFLQEVLWSQRVLAAEQGLHLPMGSFHDHYLATLDVRDLAEGPVAPPRAAGMWQRVVRDAESHDGRSLISHELFAGATSEQAAAAVGSFAPDTELHLVLTVRDLVRQIPAEWQEHVKHRATATFPEFIGTLREADPGTWFWRVQDFADLADRWGSSLPPERVHIVTVPPAGGPPTELWRRFAGLLGIDDPDAFNLQSSRPNTSLGYEQAELLRRVNVELGERLPLPGPYPGVVKDLFAQRLLAQRKGTKLALDGDALAFAQEKSAELARRLGEPGYDVVGDLADLVPDISTSTGPGQDDLPTSDQLLDEGVAALAALLEEVHRLRRRADHVTEERNRAQQRPFRQLLINTSERWSPAMRLRVQYAHARDRVRRRDQGASSADA